VLERAPREALSLGHTYVGPEHILLSLLALGDDVPVRILLDCQAEPERIRAEVLRIVVRPPEPAEPAALGQAPPSGNGFEEWIRVGPGAGLRRLLMLAAARALDEGREDIQPRDVLLALTRDEQAGPLLAELGVDDIAIRRAIERRRPPGPSAEG
jgi:ATP-dependent Clp protease ATP-binding subunit ClpC